MWSPAPRLTWGKIAWSPSGPELSEALPRSVLPSVKWTSPVGVPVLPVWGVTVAVSTYLFSAIAKPA